MKAVFTNPPGQDESTLLSIRRNRKYNFWLKISQESEIILSKKYRRILALYHTSLYILQTEGAANLFKQIYHFLRGERHNNKILTFTSPKVYKYQHTKRAYKRWMRLHELTKEQIQFQRVEEKKLEYRPVISVLTLIKTFDKSTLERMILSVFDQTYPNWELYLICGISKRDQVSEIVGKYSRSDKRIKLKYLNDVSEDFTKLNETIESANGEFVFFLRDEDEIAVNALYENVQLLNQNPDADVLYSDEDKLDKKNQRYEPYFKPDWSPDLFYSTMYISNTGVYRKSFVKSVGGLCSRFHEIQHNGLMLKLIEVTGKIYHIPKILYHRRKAKREINYQIIDKQQTEKALISAISEHFQRLNIEVEVTKGLTDDLLRVKRKLPDQPKISIIVPTRDNIKFLQQCIESIQQRSSYKNYELIVVDNNNSDVTAVRYLKKLSQSQDIAVLKYEQPFNFAAINNFASKYATGELLLFLNDDTKVISEEWLESMVEHAVRPEVGAVGARLLYSNGMVQHAGVITGIGGIAGHSHKYFPDDHSGYFNRAKAIQNLSAVTGACMMVKKAVFESIGGFDEENLAIAYNDIDFCLKLRQRDLLVVYTPYAKLYHYESVSRGSDQNSEASVRLQKETNYMKLIWKDILASDPYYNPNLTMEKENFSLSYTRKVT